jgi:Leucine-rich repeat (LRR) protein
MGILKHVAYIDLSTNELNGDISTTIRGWSHLETLKLSVNDFDSIPSSLNGWKMLKDFDISSNRIKGPIPNSLALQTQLVYLNIATNDFSGDIPSLFGNMTSLEVLLMHSNELQGSVPEAICSLRDRNLTEFTTDCNPKSGSVQCRPDCCTSCEEPSSPSWGGE